VVSNIAVCGVWLRTRQPWFRAAVPGWSCLDVPTSLENCEDLGQRSRRRGGCRQRRVGSYELGPCPPGRKFLSRGADCGGGGRRRKAARVRSRDRLHVRRRRPPQVLVRVPGPLLPHGLRPPAAGRPLRPPCRTERACGRTPKVDRITCRRARARSEGRPGAVRIQCLRR